jgi:hypothetical protein
MRIFDKRQPTVGIQPERGPLTPRLFHIDTALALLSTQRPRTDAVRAALDFQLDRRLELRPAPEPVVNPGCGDIFTARTGGQWCEICEHEVRPGEVVASQPGTGGLVQHVVCPIAIQDVQDVPGRGGEGGSL